MLIIHNNGICYDISYIIYLRAISESEHIPFSSTTFQTLSIFQVLPSPEVQKALLYWANSENWFCHLLVVGLWTDTWLSNPLIGTLKMRTIQLLDRMILRHRTCGVWQWLLAIWLCCWIPPLFLSSNHSIQPAPNHATNATQPACVVILTYSMLHKPGTHFSFPNVQ